MNEPYLILHKVRGEPAFDIAEHMDCAICGGYPHGGYPEDLDKHCAECEDKGYWWIIPTSGHRAYPFRQWWIRDLADARGITVWPDGAYSYIGPADSIAQIPADWPDHYPPKLSPSIPRKAISSLLATLGLAPKAAVEIKRRKL